MCLATLMTSSAGISGPCHTYPATAAVLISFEGCCCVLPTDSSRLAPAGAFFSILAGIVNKRKGRKVTMLIGGAAFCIGAILCAFAQVGHVALAGWC